MERQFSRIATGTLCQAQQTIRETAFNSSGAAARLLQDSVLGPHRAVARATTQQQALSRKQALLAATALQRVALGVFDPTITSTESLARRLDDYHRGNDVAHLRTLARARHVLHRPSRTTRATAEIFQRLDRPEQTMKRVFARGVPALEPIPGFDGTPLRRLPPIGRLLPSDEIVADIQKRTIEWLAIFCPKAITCMTAAHDALLRGDQESMAHAVTSCRRALTAITDAVAPPARGTRRDHTGKERKVGPEEYRNRLVIYFGARIPGRSGREFDIAETELLIHRINAVVPRLGKGVHGDLHYEDAAQIYLATWMVIMEAVRVSPRQ